MNDAFTAVNRLIAAGADVYWLQQAVKAEGRTHPAGTFYVRNNRPGTAAEVAKAARELGLTFTGTGSRPGGEHLKLNPLRIALWDRYGGSMESGWTRWLLEQFQFPFEVVYASELDAGGLRENYDVIVFVDGSIPAPPRADAPAEGRGGFGGGGPDTTSLPAEFRHMVGSVSAAQTVPQLRAFLEAGGTIVTIGTGTNLAYHLDLPVSSALVEAENGGERALPRSKYYVPGSVLQARLDTSHPLAHGMSERVDFFFDNSPVFRLGEDAAARSVRSIAWFDTATPLRSGWAWGQQYLENGIVAAAAQVGAGDLFLFGPEVAFRAQPHGTFKLLFNGIYLGPAEKAKIK